MSAKLTRRSVFAAALATPFLSRRATHAAGLRRVVQVGVVNPLDTATGQTCVALANAVAASPVLSGAIQVEVHANGELGGELEMVKACVNGTLHLAVVAPLTTSSIVPEIGLLDMPFFFRDATHARAVLDSPIGSEFADLLHAKGINLLAWTENGVRHVTANRPVRKPEDLQGLHIRVPQSDVMLLAFKALGANPDALPFPQLYEALRTGRFEAEENPVPTVLAARFAEVQKCLNLTAHSYSAALIMVSPDLLDDLDDGQRAALIACSKVAARASRDFASQRDSEGIATLRQAGMTIVEDVDRAAFIATARPALEPTIARLGGERAVRIREFHV